MKALSLFHLVSSALVATASAARCPLIQSGLADPSSGYAAWESAVQAPVANMVIYDNFEAYHLIAKNTSAMTESAKDYFKTKVTNKFIDCVANGVTPYLKWSPRLSGFGEGETSEGTIYKAILNPKTAFDNYIHWYAEQLQEAFHSTGVKAMYIEFAPQMNSALESYGGPANLGGAADFVKVWQRVHTILSHYGPKDSIVPDGTNKVIQFVWTISTIPNAVSYTGHQFIGPTSPPTTLTNFGLENYYPGDDFVDFTGMTVFSNDGESFDSKAAAAYARLIVLANKPVFVSEIAVSTAIPGQENRAAEWITAAMNSLSTKYTTVCGFNYYSHGKYDISTGANADSAEAFRASQASNETFTHTSYTEQTLDCSPDLHPGPYDADDRAFNHKNLAYNPTSTKECCAFKCDTDAACREGCDMWIHHSSLNWESAYWRGKLQTKCRKECNDGNAWKAYQHSFGNSAGYHENRTVTDVDLCKAGCDNYRSCFAE